MNFFEIPIGLDYGYHWINQNNKKKVSGVKWNNYVEIIIPI